MGYVKPLCIILIVKPNIKTASQTLAIVLTAPLALAYRTLCTVSDRNELTTAFSQLMSLVPGKTGSYLRVGFYRTALLHCDADSFIGFGTLFSQHDTEIGKHSYIGPHCNIGSSRIEAHCLIGSGVHILSGKKQHSFASLDKPIREQGGHFQKVTIGEDSWIGNGAIIMADVGKNCIVGAGAVVTEPVPERSVVAGNPASIVKQRN